MRKICSLSVPLSTISSLSFSMWSVLRRKNLTLEEHFFFLNSGHQSLEKQTRLYKTACQTAPYPSHKNFLKILMYDTDAHAHPNANVRVITVGTMYFVLKNIRC